LEKRLRKNSVLWLLLAGMTIAAFGAPGCQSKNRSATSVARIDNTSLTLEEIMAHLDTTRSISDAQVHAFVQRWVTDELFYREALRRGLDQQSGIAQQMSDIRRQLVINALLDQEIYSVKSSECTPEEIRAYYEEHKKEFLLTNDVVLISSVLFIDRESANTFRATVLRGTPWSQALRAQETSPQQKAGVIASSDSMYFTQQTLFPAALWRTATGIGINTPSFHVQTEEGYYVLIVWKYGRAGQPADVKYAEKEIRGRLTIERRQRLYTALLENLRAKHAVEVLVTPGTRDTSTQKVSE
jgi:hypothetical protein